jgi:hypothetical protein
MKTLSSHKFNPKTARKEWSEFDALTKTKSVLKEQADILPFFKKRHDLSLLLGHYFPSLKTPDVLSHEFTLAGDFRVDLVVGDSTANQYLFIEFEDGSPTSVFKNKKGRSSRVWAPRFDAAFSQIVDWFYKVDDLKPTSDFKHTFGSHMAQFVGLIVIGKDMKLDPKEAERQKWRDSKVSINGQPVLSTSFDVLKTDLDYWLTNYYGS